MKTSALALTNTVSFILAVVTAIEGQWIQTAALAAVYAATIWLLSPVTKKMMEENLSIIAKIGWNNRFKWGWAASCAMSLIWCFSYYFAIVGGLHLFRGEVPGMLQIIGLLIVIGISMFPMAMSNIQFRLMSGRL